MLFKQVLEISKRKLTQSHLVRSTKSATRNSIYCFCLLAVSLFAHGASAQSSSLPSASSTATLSGSSSRVRIQPFFDEISLGLTEDIYFNRKDMTSGVGDYTRFSGRVRSVWQKYSLGGGLNVGGSYSTNIERENVIEVPEVYLQWRFMKEEKSSDGAPSMGHFRLGRKLETWSQLDSNWKLGLWQPLNRFDGLRVTEQGMTGLFMDFSIGKVRSVLFVSSIFIPEQGPSYKLDNGQFTSNSPWFETPADKLILYSKETDLRYKINTPTIAEVINQHSFGGMVSYGGTQPGTYAQFAYAKKPRNQIALPYEGRHVTTELSQTSQVTISPEVVYHNLTSADVGYRFNDKILSLSAIYDVSDAHIFKPNLTSQAYEPLTLLSPGFEFKAFTSKYWAPRVKISALHSIGGAVRTVGPSDSSTAAFNPRTVYRDALSLQMKSRFSWTRGWMMEPSLQWIEEVSEKGSVLSGRLQVLSQQGWKMGVFADFLASRQATDQNVGFISRYRGNDRFGADLSYVF